MSNMYEFIGKNTFNPLAGSCSHLCSYCWLNELKARFPLLKEKYSGEIRLDKKAMKKNLGYGKTWFICSCNDLFAGNVPDWMIIRVLEHCKKYDNEYLFQTKNPYRYGQFKEYLPPNVILATTIETNEKAPGEAPCTSQRGYFLKVMSRLGYKTMVTIEPIMAFDLERIVGWMNDIKPIQVNLGANSNKNIKLPEPTGDEVRALIKALQDAGIKVHEKDNLKRITG